MKDEKIMLEDIFTWQDIINFSLTNYDLNCNYLEKCYSKKNRIDFLRDHCRNFIGNKIREEFPDFPFDDECFDYHFHIEEDGNGKNNLYLNFSKFFMDIFTSCVNHKLDKQSLMPLLDIHNPTLKEDIINQLKLYKNELNNGISRCGDKNMIMGYNIDFNIKITKEELKESLLAKRKMIVWVIRHYDELSHFIREPLDLDILNVLNKDKFLLVMATLALEKSGVLSGNIEKCRKDSIQVLHNYILLLEYLNSENDQKYHVSFSTPLKNGQLLLVTSDTIFSQYQKLCEKHKEWLDSYHFSTSYEEILQNHAQETWKKLQNEKLIRNIQVSWEMIPTSENTSLYNYSKSNGTRIVANSDKGKANLKKAYDLVEKKIEYFSNTNPVCKLTGINTFEGYLAYMYSNGVVVFEKFYRPKTVRTVDLDGNKAKKVIMVPVDGEAIYVMNFKNFAYYSKYTKPILIQESAHNPDIDRINHTQNGSWKSKVDKVIHGPGYGNLDLEQVDEIAKQLAKRV